MEGLEQLASTDEGNTGYLLRSLCQNPSRRVNPDVYFEWDCLDNLPGNCNLAWQLTLQVQKPAGESLLLGDVEPAPQPCYEISERIPAHAR